MYIFTLFLVIPLAAIMGSYLNVLISRASWTETLKGRSHCPKCNAKLTWKELIPIFSYLSQNGKCKSCDKPIDQTYIFVECMAVLMSLLVIVRFGITYESVALLVSLFFLIPLAVIDVQRKELPAYILNPFIAITLAYVVISALIFENAFLVVAGPLFALPILILYLVTKGKGMGFGDVLLALPLGWLIGDVFSLFAAMVLSFWIGAIIAVSIMFHQRMHGDKHLKLSSQIPFAPFLISASFFALLFL